MSEKSSNNGLGFLNLLTLLFIGLKLTNHIDWSWWWVLSPLSIPFTVLFLIFIICLLKNCFK